MPDALDMFAPPPEGLDSGLLDSLLSETFREAGKLMESIPAPSLSPTQFAGLYDAADVGEPLTDIDGWLPDVAEIEAGQSAPMLPDAAEFAQDKLMAKPGMEWLAGVEAVLVVPHSPDAHAQRAQLDLLTALLREEAQEVPAAFFPRAKNYVASKVLGMDTETTGLDTRCRYGYDGRLIPGTLLVGVTVAPTPHKGYYLPVRHTGEDGVGNWLPEVIAAWIGDLLAEFLAVFHNAAYDLEVLALNGAPILRTFPYVLDTQILSYIYDINQTMHGLKPCSERILGRKMIEIAALFVGIGGIKKNAFIAFEHLNATQALVYGASDSMNTLGLFHFFATRVGDDNVFQSQPIPVSVDHRLIDTIRDMLRTGLPVNYEYYFFALKDAIYRRFLLQKAIDAAAGKPINIGSQPQLLALLFEQFKLPPLPTMRTGANGRYSLDEKAIADLHAAYPDVEILNLVVLVRKLGNTISKIYSKLLTNCWSDAFQPYLRVKLGFSQTRTVTGRLASAGNDGRKRVTVRQGKKSMLYTLQRGAWEAGINAQGVSAGPFRTTKARRVAALPAAAGVNVETPYPPEIEAEFIKACAEL